MESIYLISDFSNKIKRLAESLKLPAQNIISYQYKENESGYHTWLNDEFKAKEIDKIIIPVSISNDHTVNTIGLLLGLHIRLNYELTLEKRLIPIIFLSNFTVENLIKVNSFDSDNNPQNLIFTKGVYFSSFDIEDIQKTIISSTPCLKADYYKNVLSKLNINRKEALGGHDIANAWGCFKVAQVVGFDDRIFQLYPIAKHLKQLYAKHLICKNQTFSNEKRIDLNPIKCNGKKILFIDDKADEGWAELMKNLFKGAGDNFKFVDSAKYKADDLHKSFKDFDGFYKECQSHIGKDWDLIIIDLRLNPEKEDVDNEMIAPTDFTGYKLINEFLTKNEGYQIIVLTASNKIWNINAALKRGAYSYFIKESPEFNYPISETKKLLDKFKNDIVSCFDRGYLREVYLHWKNAKSTTTNLTENFIAESGTSLDIAWEQIKSGFLDFGFLTIFQSIESYANLIFKYDTLSYSYKVEENNVIENINPDEKQWLLTFENDISGDYFKTGKLIQKSHIKPTTLFKVSCILHLKLGKDDAFLKDFGKLNKLRNDIAHGGSSNLATKQNLISVLNLLEEIRSI
jgi:CheY-like chemotaxis protein